MRINKYLAECGVCSRRMADEFVKQGRVSVNKKIVKEVGSDIDVENDVVFVDGKKIVRITHYDYLMFNKPKGCVTTANDDNDIKNGRLKKLDNNTDVTTDIKKLAKRSVSVGTEKMSNDAGFVINETGQTENEQKKPRKTVFDYIGNEYADKRLFSVGRLDYDSEGLLLLTNDGNMTYKLTHPSSEIPKTYVVKIEGNIDESDLAILRKGVVVEGVRYNRCKAKVTGIEHIKNQDGSERTLTRLEVIIFEGKNREIRRMFSAVEKNVVFLKRIAIGDLRLGGVSRGGYRELNDFEIAYLLKLCEKTPVASEIE